VNLLRLLLPRAWRRRYGDELLDELRSRRATPALLLDVLVLVVRLRAEQLGRHLVAVLVICLPAAAGGAFATYSAVGRLAHGWVELPGHWWSAPWPALTIAFLAIAGAACAGRRLSRT
jgi:hypothetical protein